MTRRTFTQFPRILSSQIHAAPSRTRHYQFFMFRPKTPSPLLTLLWNDEYAKKIPSIDYKARSREQNAYLDRYTHEVALGMSDLIKASVEKCPKKDETTAVIASPELSFSTGVPITERQLSNICLHLEQTLSGLKANVNIHLASLFVIPTGETVAFKEFSEELPKLLNVAIIGRSGIDGISQIRVYFKQIIDPNDLMNADLSMIDLPSMRDVDNPSKINLNRVLRLQDASYDKTSPHAMMVGELCLEHRKGLALVALAKTILRDQEIYPSVEYEDYVGYHVLSSDSIELIPDNAAFRVISHSDARNPPRVVILDEDGKEQTDLPIQENISISSASRVVDGGTVSIFPAIRLQPARAIVASVVEDFRNDASTGYKKSP